MKTFIKTLIFCLLTMIISSCSQEYDRPELEDSLLSKDFYTGKIKIFKNIEDLKSTLNLFKTFTGNSDFEHWSKQQEYLPLYNYELISYEEKERIPFSFLFILNENKQFQIGNKLITYSKGVFYENSFDSSGSLIKEHKVFATTKQTLIPQGETTSTNEKITIDASGGIYKQGWQEFIRDTYRVGCGTPFNKSLRYRLVHYLIVQTFIGPLITNSDLIFKLRMSQKTSSGWKYNNTSTERLYDLNLSGTWAVESIYGGTITPITNFSINDNNSCSNPLKGTKLYWVASHNFIDNVNNYIWGVSLNGPIFHKVNGDTNELNTNINW